MTAGQAESRHPWLPKLLRDEVVKKTFWIVVLGLLSAGYALWKRRSDLDLVSIVSTAIACLIAGLWVGTHIWKRRSQSQPYFERMTFPYEVKRKSITYHIDDNGLLHFKRSVVLRARVDGVDRYLDKYVWTGGPSQLPTKGAGVKATRRVARAGIWTFYETDFDRQLRKGQEHAFEVVWPPLENWRHASPFVSVSAEEPTECIHFDVRIPDRFRGSRSAMAEELRAIEAHNVYNTKEMNFDNDRLEWTIRAKLFRHYRIRWSWADEGEVQSIGVMEFEPEQEKN